MQVNYRPYQVSSADVHNLHLADVITPGVYKGFNLRLNGSNPSRIDLVSFPETKSVAFLPSGINITNDSDIIAAASVSGLSSTLRYDPVVLYYNNTSDLLVDPVVQCHVGNGVPSYACSQHEVLLGFIRRRPMVSGATQDDLLSVSRVGYSLCCELDTRTAIVYLSPGSYTTSDGAAQQLFPGAYLAIDTSIAASFPWILIGLSDAGVPTVVDYKASFTELSFKDYRYHYIAAIQVNASGVVLSVVPVTVTPRVAPTRASISPFLSALDNSVFASARIDVLDDNTFLRTSPVHGVVTTTVQSPAADIVYYTDNVMQDIPVSAIGRIQVLVDASCSINFQVSGIDSASAFDPNLVFTSGDVVDTGNISELYLKLIVPAVSSTSVQSIYGFAVLHDMDVNAQVPESILPYSWEAMQKNLLNLLPSFIDFPYSWKVTPSGIGTTAVDSKTIAIPNTAIGEELYVTIPATELRGQSVSFLADHNGGSSVLYGLRVGTAETTKTFSANSQGVVSATVPSTATSIVAFFRSTAATGVPTIISNPRMAIGVHTTLPEMVSYRQPSATSKVIRIYQTVYGSSKDVVTACFPLDIKSDGAVVEISESHHNLSDVSYTLVDGSLLATGTLRVPGVGRFDSTVGVSL